MDKPKSKEWLCGGTKIIKATKEEREYYAELDITCPGCSDCEPEQPNALKGIPLTIHPVKKIEQVPNKPLEQPTNSPLMTKEKTTPDIEPEMRAENIKVVSQPLEQPNTELMIIKTIQGLISQVNDNLGKLNEGISVLEHCTDYRPRLISKAFGEIDLFQRTTLNKLQKAFE